MSFIAAGATLAVGLYSANQQRGAADDARRASQSATDQTIAEQRRQYDLTRSDQMPWLDAGRNALDLQGAYLAGDTSGFDKSPDYAFAVQQGTQALDRGAAARGNLFGGGADADRIALGQGLATQYAGNYWNKLAGLSGTGQSTASGLGGLGMGMASNIGNALTGNAETQRQSSYARADANSQLASGIGGQFNNWYNNNLANNPGGTGFYFGNNPGRG